MHHRPLGRTGLSVSRICLGTMTFGEQNTEAEAHRQIDIALDAGVDFIDAAEMYPIPPRPETQGRTEEILGSWFATRGRRGNVVLATKITGPGPAFAHIRDGALRFDRPRIRAAVDLSLKRLRTDYIDLYQLHWPERPTNIFGRRGYDHAADAAFTPLGEVLDALGDEVRRGTVRAVGVSNETPWGAMSYLGLAGGTDRPRMASIQNPYSLLNRLFEVGLAEVALREGCGLLAYSPLAFGTLSGKYLNGARPAGARLTLFPQYGRYTKPAAVAATRDYVDLARRFGLDPAAMALAYVVSRPFVTSAIIGATTEEQLRANLAAEDLALDAAVVEGIEAIHERSPNPAP